MTQQFTIRNWAVGHQKVVHRFQVAPTDLSLLGTSAFASVREWDHTTNQAHLGDARMYVCNIVVGSGYIDVWIQIDWDSDLEYEITLLVVNF